MNLDEFMYNLHFDIDKVRPVDMEVNFDDAPLPYKLYRGLPEFLLPLDGSLCETAHIPESKPGTALSHLGKLFWYTFGLTKVCRSFSPFGITEVLRRYVPSGGALYPNEVYAYLKVDSLPHGVYHYNVAHHSLMLLREGNLDAYLEHALGERCDIRSAFGIIFISTMFWKNFFKYNNFSYRLQGIDAGIVAGQLFEVSGRLGYRSILYYQFLDKAMNHLLGLYENEESVYAIISLSTQNKMSNSQVTGGSEHNRIVAEDLCRELAPIQHEYYQKSRNIGPCPVITNMNDASMLHSTDLFRTMDFQQNRQNAGAQRKAHVPEIKVKLPEADSRITDLESACSKRYSPGLDFVFSHTDAREVANLLHRTAHSFAYDNDIGESTNRLSLALCLHYVDGISDGAYLYCPETHSLSLLQAGDHRHALQNGLSMPNVNLFQTPICVHIVGDVRHMTETFGYRGYRIQQMEVGIMVQHLLLSSVLDGMNGHALLGFDEALSDRIYNLAPVGNTCLIEVPIGHYRTWSRLEGSVSG